MELLKSTFDPKGEKKDVAFDPTYHAATLVLLAARSIPMLENMECANVSCITENMMFSATDLYLWYAPKAVNNDIALLDTLQILKEFVPVA